jgi:hypothetical protein
MMLAGYGILAVVLVLLPPSATPAGIADCDLGVGNTYVGNSTFEANLNHLAAELPGNVSTAHTGGFAVATVGADPDQVFALALCRGDVNATACRACVAAAFVDGKNACPGINGVTVYEDACVVRFSGQRFMDFLSPDQWQVTEMMYGQSTYLPSFDLFLLESGRLIRVARYKQLGSRASLGERQCAGGWLVQRRRREDPRRPGRPRRGHGDGQQLDHQEVFRHG